MWFEFNSFYTKKLLNIKVNNAMDNMTKNQCIIQVNLVKIDKKIDNHFNAFQEQHQRFEAHVLSIICTVNTTMDTNLGTVLPAKN